MCSLSHILLQLIMKCTFCTDLSLIVRLCSTNWGPARNLYYASHCWCNVTSIYPWSTIKSNILFMIRGPSLTRKQHRLTKSQQFSFMTLPNIYFIVFFVHLLFIFCFRLLLYFDKNYHMATLSILETNLFLDPGLG